MGEITNSLKNRFIAVFLRLKTAESDRNFEKTVNA